MTGTIGMTDERRDSRIIVRDEGGRVLLFQHKGSNGMTFWAPPGGGLNDNETFEQAGLREAREELGVTNAPLRFLWEGVAEFTYLDRYVHQRERFFLLAGNVADFTTDVLLTHRQEGITGVRWWTVSELETTAETVFPDALAAKLRGIPN
jgi:ADP-ribose pyrophosphatase YjhB (NUDIX family)